MGADNETRRSADVSWVDPPEGVESMRVPLRSGACFCRLVAVGRNRRGRAIMFRVARESGRTEDFSLMQVASVEGFDRAAWDSDSAHAKRGDEGQSDEHEGEGDAQHGDTMRTPRAGEVSER